MSGGSEGGRERRGCPHAYSPTHHPTYPHTTDKYQLWLIIFLTVVLIVLIILTVYV